jgi:hypothetical protein
MDYWQLAIGIVQIVILVKLIKIIKLRKNKVSVNTG